MLADIAHADQAWTPRQDDSGQDALRTSHHGLELHLLMWNQEDMLSARLATMLLSLAAFPGPADNYRP